MRITIETENFAGKKQVTELLYCSFCGKQSDFVKKIVMGPGVFICNECVELCLKIMIEESLPIKQEVQGE